MSILPKSKRKRAINQKNKIDLSAVDLQSKGYIVFS